MDEWEIRRTGPASAEANMRRDAELLRDLRVRPILHLYDWEGDSATYGHFIRPEEHLNLDGVKEHGLSLAKRPTGGGILFHTCDLAFSVLIPASHPGYRANTLENYRWVNAWVGRAIERFLGGSSQLLPEDPQPLDAASRHFCMAKPTIYDVMIGSRKVGGAAQRRTRAGFLHQGTIALVRPERAFLDAVLKSDTQVADAMERHTYPLLEDPAQLEEARVELRELLVSEAHAVLA